MILRALGPRENGQSVRSMEFDLDDPMLLWREDVLADPRLLYDRLRRDAPVWRLPGQETYLVSDPGGDRAQGRDSRARLSRQ